MRTSTVESIAREICDRLSHAGHDMPWEQRLQAAVLLLHRLTNVEVEVLPVRAVLYSRSARYRLGGPMMPEHAGDVAHIREQVGSSMVLLGVERLHAVILVGSVMIEMIDAQQWSDQGVLLRPFVADRPIDLSQWTVEGLRYGVSVTYEHRPEISVALTADLVAHRLANDVQEAMNQPARRRA